MRYCPIPYGKFDSILMKQPKHILHVYVIKLKCRQCSKFRTIANVQIPKMLQTYRVRALMYNANLHRISISYIGIVFYEYARRQKIWKYHHNFPSIKSLPIKWQHSGYGMQKLFHRSLMCNIDPKLYMYTPLKIHCNDNYVIWLRAQQKCHFQNLVMYIMT